MAKKQEVELAKRDPERLERMRAAVRYLVKTDQLVHGIQSRLAEHFLVSRQRVHQIVVQEKRRSCLQLEKKSTVWQSR